MKGSFSIQARGASTTVYAALIASGNVSLECGDAFAATVDGRRVPLSVDDLESGSGPVHYEATVASPTSATTATLSLERGAPKTSAPTTTLYLPAPFALRDVSPRVKISANEEIKFRLDPPMKIDVPTPTPESVQLRVEIEGSCLEKGQFTWSKSGVLFPPLVQADGIVALVNANQFLKRKGTEASCEVTLRVAEFTAGTIDAAFAGPVGAYPAEGSRHEEATFQLEW